LVGAGPGDPDLLTLRGAELIATADAVLHDELVHPALLARARKDASVEYVGKRGADPVDKQTSQVRIEARLIELARAGRSVVRLKGGDPYLFGRGSEEAEALAAAKVAFEIVPGVTSPLAVGAYAGVSLTHRDLASSVVILSGTTRHGEPFDLRELAGVRGTVVVLMAHKRLEHVTEALMRDAGRAATTPALVVSQGTLGTQRSVEGTLSDIAAKTRRANLPTPAILYVGDVVTLRARLRFFDQRPLFGKRVLVLRAGAQAAATSAALRRRGALPIEQPLLRVVDVPDVARVDRAIAELASYDVVAFTSENGVEKTFDALARAGRDARAFGAARVAVVGEGTAALLRAHGVRPDIVPAVFRGEALAAAILDDLGTSRSDGAAGARVALLRAKVAREILPETLRAHGVIVDVVPVYETLAALPEEVATLRERFESGEIDVVLATSSSTVDALVAAVGDRDASSAPAAIGSAGVFAAIGGVTAATAAKHGVRVDVTAEVSSLEGLLSAVESRLRGG